MELDPRAKVSNTGAKLPSVEGKLARWFCSVDRPSGVKKEFLKQKGILYVMARKAMHAYLETYQSFVPRSDFIADIRHLLTLIV